MIGVVLSQDTISHRILKVKAKNAQSIMQTNADTSESSFGDYNHVMIILILVYRSVTSL
jgi:hypothetical protein